MDYKDEIIQKVWDMLHDEDMHPRQKFAIDEDRGT